MNFLNLKYYSLLKLNYNYLHSSSNCCMLPREVLNKYLIRNFDNFTVTTIESHPFKTPFSDNRIWGQSFFILEITMYFNLDRAFASLCNLFPLLLLPTRELYQFPSICHSLFNGCSSCKIASHLRDSSLVLIFLYCSRT